MPAPLHADEGSITTVLPARIVALVVTYNRAAMVERILRSIARQTFPSHRLSVVVIDNAGGDGTSERLTRLFQPDLILENSSDDAACPDFSPLSHPKPDDAGARNALGLASLVLIRNTRNHGGCGGFNTGFAAVEAFFTHQDRASPFARPDRVWLVDDDADVPPDTLEHLARTLDADPDAGLAGSRTVDIADRLTTIETTIYFDPAEGRMSDHPPPGHPLHAAHQAWAAATGGTKGARRFSGVREVNVVSACSMLARWSAVVGPRDDEHEGWPAARAPVGFWDRRFFIYCDDADWCLRFARAGWKVLLNLDAVVFHTPWLLKLTPARIYYAQRNAIWMSQKGLRGRPLRRITRRWLRTLLLDALHAGLHRRLFHAEIIRRTALDTIDQVAGKTGSDGPPPMPIPEALRAAGYPAAPGDAFTPPTPAPRVLFLCGHADAVSWAEQTRDAISAALNPSGITPSYNLAVRNDVPNHQTAGDGWASRIIYGGRRRSRFKKQFTLARLRPHLTVVFDQTNDLPVLPGPLTRPAFTLHIDLKRPDLAQVERHGVRPLMGFLLRWCAAGLRCEWHALTVRPFRSASRYG